MNAKQRLEKACDDLCREIVKLRDKNKCRLCEGIGCDPHHIARRGGNVRWFIDSIILICRDCHRTGHDDELNMNINIVRVIGAEKFEELQMMAREIKQWKQADLKILKSDLTEILNYYKAKEGL